MKITKEWLEEVEACSEGVDWFNSQKETDSVKVINKLVKEDRWDWANWTICRLFSKENKIRYAIFAAEQTLDNFEKVYPNDKRPRQAIEAALKYLNEPTEENKSAVRSAESAARSAESAALNKMRTKIINYGIKLLEVQK